MKSTHHDINTLFSFNLPFIAHAHAKLYSIMLL